MNIAEILKYCPKGTKLYSTVFGEVEFSKINPDDMIVINVKDNGPRVFLRNGSYSKYGECVLFPSKDQRDWAKFRLPVKRGDIMMFDNKAFIISDEYANVSNGAISKIYYRHLTTQQGLMRLRKAQTAMTVILSRSCQRYKVLSN